MKKISTKKSKLGVCQYLKNSWRHLWTPAPVVTPYPCMRIVFNLILLYSFNVFVGRNHFGQLKSNSQVGAILWRGTGAEEGAYFINNSGAFMYGVNLQGNQKFVK